MAVTHRVFAAKATHLLRNDDMTRSLHLVFAAINIVCHDAKVVPAFEANTPFEKLFGSQIA
jgi:hypothetical protein